MDDFIERLFCGKFGSGERTGRDILQSERIGILFLWCLDNGDNSLFNGLYKPNQNEGVDGVEQGMEHGKSVQNRCAFIRCGLRNHKALNTGIGQAEQRDDVSDKREERLEENQCPNHTEEVEYGVRHGSTLGLGVTHRGGNIGGDGGTDVLAQHHGTSHIERNPAHAEHNERDGHCGG